MVFWGFLVFFLLVLWCCSWFCFSGDVLFWAFLRGLFETLWCFFLGLCLSGFAFLVMFYFWPFLRAFWGFIFSRVLKQIQGGVGWF